MKERLSQEELYGIYDVIRDVKDENNHIKSEMFELRCQNDELKNEIARLQKRLNNN